MYEPVTEFPPDPIMSKPIESIVLGVEMRFVVVGFTKELIVLGGVEINVLVRF